MAPVLQQVRFSHRFPHAIWHGADISGRRLLIDAPEDGPVPAVATAESSAAMLMLLRLLLLLLMDNVDVGVSSSGCNVAEWIP